MPTREHETSALDHRAELLEPDEIVRKLLMEDYYSGGTEYAMDLSQTSLLIGDLAQDSHQHDNVKVSVREWEARTRVTGRVTDVLERFLHQLTLGFSEHLGLEVEQLKATTSNTTSKLNTEVSRSWPDLQNAIRL